MEDLTRSNFYELLKEYKYIIIIFILNIIIFSILFGSIEEAFKVVIPLWAVIWAIYHQEIKKYIHRPILTIRQFSHELPYLRRAPISNTDFIGFFINIPLENQGKRIAKNCQPMITAMGKFINGSWVKDKIWIPVALRWAGGEDYENIGTGLKVREERNIIPHRLYFFNLGYITTNESDKFTLFQIIRLTGQNDSFDPGKYCFEVTVTAEEINSPTKKYFIVDWKGSCIDNINEMINKLILIERDKAPW